MSDMYYGMVHNHPRPSEDFKRMQRSLCAGRADEYSASILDVRMRTWFKSRFKKLVVRVKL